MQSDPPIRVLGAMLTEAGLLLAGLAQDAPLAAGVDGPQASAAPLLRFDRSEQGALAFFAAPADAGAGTGVPCGRFVAWLPSPFVPALPVLSLRMMARTGSVHCIDIEPESYRSFAARGLPALYPHFTPLIDNMVELTQAPGHPLRAVMRVLADALAAETAAALARPVATGAFDFIAHDVAHGWAWDPRLPEVRQLVEITDGAGTVVARGHAEHFRPDLPAAGVGDGHHHFRIPLPWSLRDGALHRLSARLPDSGVQLAAAGPGAVHDYLALPAPLAFFDMMPAPAAYDRARRLPSDAARDAALHVHALIDHAQPRAAHDAALALLAEHGDSGLACCKLGEALLILGQGADAVQAYLRARAADPRCPYACLGLGNGHALCGEWSEAEAAYRAGLALDAACAPLAARLAQAQPRAFKQQVRLLMGSGQTQEVVAGLTEHLFAHPGDDDACALLERALSPGVPGPQDCAQARRLKVYALLLSEAAKRKGLVDA